MENPVTSSTSNSDRGPLPSHRWRTAQAKPLTIGVCTFVILVVMGGILQQFSPAIRHNIAVEAAKPASAGYYLSYCHGAVDDYAIYHDLDHLSNQIKKADVLFLGS